MFDDDTFGGRRRHRVGRRAVAYGHDHHRHRDDSTRRAVLPLPDRPPPPPPPPTDRGTAANVVGVAGIAAWYALPANEKAKVRAKSSILLHQSVGRALEDGVEAVGFNYATYDTVVKPGLNGQMFVNYNIRNGNPSEKTARWQLESTKAGNAALTVSNMKYGYADVTASLLATAKTAYMNAVTAIKASGKAVVHVTPPLVFDTAKNPRRCSFGTGCSRPFRPT